MEVVSHTISRSTQVLDLTNNEICGIKATGTDPFNAYVLKMVCALAQVEIIIIGTLVMIIIKWRPANQPVSVPHCRDGLHCAWSHGLSHSLAQRPGGGLKRLKLKSNHLIGNDTYTAEAVHLISDALRSEHCQLEELHLGLTNKGSGLREDDGLKLGIAVQVGKWVREWVSG